MICGKDTSPNLHGSLSEILHFPLWDSQGKYLGIPVEWGNSKGQTLQWTNEIVFSNIEGWKKQFLSQAEKEVLIKFVIQVIPSYVMALVRLPKNFCQSLCFGVTNFWLSSKVRNKGKHWKSWQFMCSTKNKGGLGFKDFTSEFFSPL